MLLIVSIYYIAGESGKDDHKNRMEFDFLPFPGDWKEHKAEGCRADGHIAPKLPVDTVGIEIGFIHKHDGGRCDQPHNYGAESAEDSLYGSAFVMTTDEVAAVQHKEETWQNYCKCGEDTSEQAPAYT